ncbi:MAG: hypothetical protein ACYDCK_04445 [Thermoplasmatota archaeon]
MRGLALAALGILVVSALAPSLPAASAPGASGTSLVTFYGHVFSTGLDNPMPANTQFPVGEDNVALGSFAMCSAVGSLDGVGVDRDHAKENKLALYSTPGFVQVSNAQEFVRKGSYASLHNEHGSTKDIELDVSQHVKATIFTSADFVGWIAGGPTTDCFPADTPYDVGCPWPYFIWDPAVLPDSVVHARLYYAILGAYGAAAGEKPDIQGALASGKATLVAEGMLGPRQMVNGLPGTPNAIRWDIDLGTPKVATIPKEANFFLVYQFGQLGPAGEYDHPATYRLWSGEWFPPTFTLPVKDAFDVERVVPAFVHDKLVLLAVLSTPWGSYDVDPASTRLTVASANGAAVEPLRIDVVAEDSVAHGAHYKPVNVSFIWDYRGDRLAPGTYTATVSSGNHEGSAHATCSATFTVRANGDPGDVTPGICGRATDARFVNETGTMRMQPGGSTVPSPLLGGALS